MSDSEKKKDIIDRLLDLDPKILWLFLFIAIIVPLIKPIGLPLPITQYSKDTYDFIENLPPGSTVLFMGGTSWGMWPTEYRPGTIAVIQHMIKKDIKIVFISHSAQDPVVMQDALDNFIDLKDYKYGVDYIQLGFFAGAETMYATIAADIRSLVKTDYIENKPLDTFPIMEDTNNANDFDLVFDVSGVKSDVLVRQFFTPYGVPCAAVKLSSMISDILQYYQAGQYVGFINGLLGGAEYELLSDKPGFGLASIDPLSTTHILYFILIFGVNILYFIKRGQREG